MRYVGNRKVIIKTAREKTTDSNPLQLHIEGSLYVANCVCLPTIHDFSTGRRWRGRLCMLGIHTYAQKITSKLYEFDNCNFVASILLLSLQSPNWASKFGRTTYESVKLGSKVCKSRLFCMHKIDMFTHHWEYSSCFTSSNIISSWSLQVETVYILRAANIFLPFSSAV